MSMGFRASFQALKMSWPPSLIALALVLSTAGCRGNASPTTPEDAHQAFRNALQANDSQAAYRLLSPALQTQISPAEFGRLWQDAAPIREHWRSPPTPGVKQGAKQEVAVEISGTSLAQGKESAWQYDGQRFVALTAAPAPATYGSPQALLVAVAEHLRTAATVVQRKHCQPRPEACTGLTESLLRRAQAIEAVLTNPANLEIDHLRQRASVLRENGEVWMVLEASPATGWQVAQVDD